MERYNLNAEEAMVVWLLISASIEERHPEYLFQYMQLKEHGDLRRTLLNLQVKGIINKSYQVPEIGEKFDPETVEWNKNFVHNYFKYSCDLGKELMKAYPSVCIINGSEVMLKNIAKFYNSVEDCFYDYGKAISWRKDKHEHVLSLINWAKENAPQVLNQNFGGFIKSRLWTSIEDLKEGNRTLTFDNAKVL